MGRRLRIVAVVIGTAVFMAAAVGCMMGPAPTGDPGFRATTKMWPFKQDPPAPDMRAWVEKYGQNALQMPNLPDVGAATPEQRAAAKDLLVRTEAATAGYVDLAAAEKAGYQHGGTDTEVRRDEPGKTSEAQLSRRCAGNPVLITARASKAGSGHDLTTGARARRRAGREDQWTTT